MRVFLVDDHEVVRKGIRALLESKEGFEIVGEAGSVAEAIADAPPSKPDVIMMDVRLGDGTGIEACREIRSQDPSIRVIMLTSYSDDKALFDSIMAGADGYLLKQVDSASLVSAINKVGNGESLLDPAVTHTVLDRMKELISRPADDDSELSQQEENVLTLIADGKTNREIGEDMSLSEKTIKNYVTSILGKLNLNRRSEAVAYYIRKTL